MLGLMDDDTISDLGGPSDLGIGYEEIDLGVDGQWILHVGTAQTNKVDADGYPVHHIWEAKIQRGSVEKRRNNEETHFETIYPHYCKGKVVAQPDECADEPEQPADGKTPEAPPSPH